MAIKIGQACQTPDGPGVVKEKKYFGNGVADYRLGVKHDNYPVNRIPGYYRDDVLFYYKHEVTESKIGVHHEHP